MSRPLTTVGRCATLGVLFGLAHLASAALPPRLPVEAFGRLPVMTGLDISPGGRNVAAGLLDKTGSYGVVIFDLDQLGKKPPLRASTGEWDVNWIHWKTDDRLLISGRASGYDGRVGITQTRLIAVNADGSKFKWLVRGRSVGMGGGSILPQFADRVVDFLPDDPRHVLLGFSLGDSSGPRLYQVDIDTNQRKEVEPGRSSIQWWLVDRLGHVRVAQGYDGYDSYASSFKTYTRVDEGAEWREIWNETARDESFDPVIFDKADPDVIVVRSNHDTGREGLYRFRLSSGEFIEKLFLHPEVDLSDVILDPAGREIDGVGYLTDSYHVEWFSPKMAAVQADIQAQLRGWSVRVVSRAMDDTRMIAYASAPDHSGRYYVYEPASKALRLFSDTYPELDPYDLARVTALRFKARDGLEIPVYLTLPRGVSNPPTQLLPTVILPHGGPEGRNYAAFDPEVQMLANRGYAVLQINFRGSWGYGAEFRKAGEHEWGDAIQDDITDGTRWLIQSKIADPARVCIAGSSAFGGYAALMGAAREPTLYKCAVSLNGFTDLPDFLNIVSKYGGDNRWFAKRIGRYWTDRKKLAENSPARRAADIRAPVLLVRSVEDGLVPAAQASKLVSALRASGRTFRYVELKDEGHELSHGATRLQYFKELDDFLAEYLK